MIAKLVIFLYQRKAGHPHLAIAIIRIGQKEWRNLDYTALDEAIPVLDHSISLEEVYRKIL